MSLEYLIQSSNEMFKNSMQHGFVNASVFDTSSNFYADSRFYFNNKEEELIALRLADDFVKLHESMQ